ncbi:MAG: hypothetical protein U9R39_01135 [Campylobacterota bacterium]|nr:hypothetical protein [Campylobacterota bacterium]
MLSTREIAEKFDIPKTTLYGWKEERPKVYEFLANSDTQYDKYRDTNILLDKYIKTTNHTKVFISDEIEYIYSLDLEINSIEDIENLHLLYINTSTKIKKENDTFTLDIYKKLESLNLIERYIFCDRLEKLKEKLEKKYEEDTDWMKLYFKEFLN